MAGLDPLTGGGEPRRLITEWTAPDDMVYPVGTLMMHPLGAVDLTKGPEHSFSTFCLEAI